MDHIVQNQKMALSHYPYLYRLLPEVGKVVDAVLAAKGKKIVSLRDIREMCVERKLGQQHMGIYARVMKLMHCWVSVVAW